MLLHGVATKQVFWRGIKWEHYAISEDGDVFTNWSGEWKRLKPAINTKGYLQVCLYPGRQRGLVHQILMQTFVGPPPLGQEVCHHDGRRTNNRLSNLRYDTKQGNCADRKRHGTLFITQGVKNGLAKLDDQKVREIIERRKAGELLKTIAASYGVCLQLISQVVRRELWRHVG